MAEEKFLMVSLKGDEAKKLAQVISNDTSRNILEHLSSVKDDTESGIAKKMHVPISTVHYNLSALLKARLVDVNEFHYSEKGKEVNHYSLANKYVIIAPKEPSETLKSKLKRILPVIFTVIGGSVLVHLFTKNTATKVLNSAQFKTFDAVEKAPEAVGVMTKTLSDIAAKGAGRAVPEVVNQTTGNAMHAINGEPNIALWFLGGAVFAILVVLLVDYVRNRK